MKITAKLMMIALLLATSATYAENFSGKCGGMEKIGPPKISDIPLEKIGCNAISAALAKKIGTLPNRTVIFHYKSTSGQLATLKISDFRKDPQNALFVENKHLILEMPTSGRKMLVNDAKDGSPNFLKLLKDWDNENRQITLLTKDDTRVKYGDGTAMFDAIIFNNIWVSATYPASNIDDAASKAKALFNATKFNLINSTDPL